MTTLERTLVDVLYVPSNAGGWEEVWRSLEMVVLTDDERLQDIVRTHPGLRWKALNVRQHRGSGPAAAPGFARTARSPDVPGGPQRAPRLYCHGLFAPVLAQFSAQAGRSSPAMSWEVSRFPGASTR